jgi:hypothetical protein
MTHFVVEAIGYDYVLAISAEKQQALRQDEHGEDGDRGEEYWGRASMSKSSISYTKLGW